MRTIRTFQPADAPAVRQLFAQGMLDFAEGFEDRIRGYIQRSLDDDLADIPAHYLNEPGNHFWVIEIDGQLKGIVGIQRRSDEEAELRRMSVASDSRRQGVGWKLLEITEAFCREQGYQRIRLGTASHLHPAIAMYRKFGYQLLEERQYGEVRGLRFVKHLTDSP